MGWQEDPIASPVGDAPQQSSWESDPIAPPRTAQFAKPQAADALLNPNRAQAEPAMQEVQFRAAASDAVNKMSGNPLVEGVKSAPKALLQGHYDSEAANLQGAANILRDRQGNYVRKVRGEIEQYDFGPVIRQPDGNIIAFDPQTEVMFRDPESGKMMAFERDKDLDNPSWFTKIARIMLGGMATNAPTTRASSDAVSLATQRGASLGFPVSPKTAAINERMRDAAAFNELDVEMFAPAFRSKGAARMARTTEEMPVIGGIVKGPKTETETALREAQGRIAADLGAAPTNEAAGYTMQQGLDRFKNARIADLEPGVLRARNIEPNEAINPRDVMSAGAETRAAAADPIRQSIGGGVAQTNRGVQVPAATTRNQTLQARRSADSMSDAEIETLIRAPAAETSFGTRQEALYEKAFRSVPDLVRANGSANPNMLAATNTRQALGGIDQQIGSQIGGQAVIGGELANRLRNPRAANFPLEDLRAMRTEVGRAIGSLNPQQTTLNSGQLKSLYGALSRDIEIGLMDLANRAMLGTRVSNNRPDYVAPEIARRADQALRDFRVADRYTRLGMARIERFTQILGAKNPEQAMRTLETRMKEGTIDRGLVRAVRDALRPEERQEILGYLVSRMGQGRPGAAEAERGWNIHGFATDWNRSKSALREMMDGVDPAIVRRLEALAQISGRMKYYETTKNYSGTAYSALPFTGIAGAIASGSAVGFIAGAITQAAGMAAIGKFLTSPKYLDWMIRAARTGLAGQTGGYRAIQSRVPVLMSQLERLAANDNELGPVISEALSVINKRAVNAEGEEPQNNNKRQ